MRVARIGYGYFNLTGGLFQMSNNGAISRFNLNESNAAAVGVGYVGGAGVVVAVWPDGSTSSLTATAGSVLPLRLIRVNSTSTTATLLVALYTI